MKRNILLLICWGIITSLYSQNSYDGQYAPINPEFLKYQESKTKGGLIPPTYTVSFDSLPKLRSTLILPAKFDLRTTGLLSTPRNQGVVNNCWAFALLDAIQSSWVRMGFATPLYSVENLSNCHGFEALKNDGGSGPMAIAYFSRFAGPVYETSDPFINDTLGTCNNTLTKNDKEALVSQALNLPKDVQTIKQMVYRYGGVLTAVWVKQLDSTAYYNADSFSVFVKVPPVGEVANHAGTIVGWDDNQVVYNPLGDNPEKPGVWIVKNTTGTSNFDGGYYYASYEDYFIGSYAYVFPQRIEKSRVDTVFYHDKLGRTTNLGNPTILTDSAYAVVKYNAATQKLITAIGTYASAASTKLDIQVYQTKTGDVLSGLLGERKGLLCEYPGFHTFDLPIAVTGDFYVKIKYKTPGYAFPVPIEKSIADNATVNVKPVDLQWIKYTESDSLQKVGIPSRQFNLCVKVYAQNPPKQALFSTVRNRYCVNDTVVFKNTSVGTYDSYNWNFGAGANPLTASTTLKNDTFKVVYATGGMKKVVLKATSGAATDSIVKGNGVEIVTGVPLNFVSNSFCGDVLINKKMFLKATGADSYHWTASSYFPDTIASVLSFVIGESPTKFIVTATLGQCVGVDSITITPTTKVLYDEIANAKQLAVGVKEGPFSNACATWRQSEPKPTTDASCTSQTDWCTGEAVLNNSLWFKFTAPTADSVKITTSGFDNQIALYDAISTGTYADIISGNPANYTILAANDDSSGVQMAATIEPIKLTAGKTYWLQMDGSYGGEEGNAYITVTGITVGVSDAKADLPFVINPAKDGCVIINNAQSVTQVELMDISGKVLKSAVYDTDKTIIMDVDNYIPGYYVVKLQTKNGFVSFKILIQ